MYQDRRHSVAQMTQPYPVPARRFSFSEMVPQRRHSMSVIEFNVPVQSAEQKKGGIRPWTVQEDKLLLELVKQYGSQWGIIASKIPGRNRRQVKEHWARVLSRRPAAKDIVVDGVSVEVSPEYAPEDTDSRRGLWSADEDQLLLDAYDKFGAKWGLIASRIPGRSARQAEKRFRRLKQSEKEVPLSPPQESNLTALARIAESSLTPSM
ncbi:hypothetical protein EDD86DRAFT_219550 [Gorgonomyces haynaldii]|nr:hypothetical protein EDD86DRAFT_219550 [Gorgonomyces haynaldii]